MIFCEFLPNAFWFTNFDDFRSPLPPWEAALAKLSLEDQLAMNISSLSGLNKLDTLNQVLVATKEKRDICLEKQWKFTWKGETIILRDVADKLLVWVDKFKAIGNVIASYDPTHAALPWAGFRFLLQVLKPFLFVTYEESIDIGTGCCGRRSKNGGSASWT